MVSPIASSRNSSSLEISLLEWATTAIMEMLYSEMPDGQFFAWLYPGTFRALVHRFLQAVFSSWWLAFSSTNVFLLYIYIKSLPLLMPLISLHFLFSFILAVIPQTYLGSCSFYPKPSNSSVPTLSFSLVCGKVVHVAIWICSCPQAPMK